MNIIGGECGMSVGMDKYMGNLNNKGAEEYPLGPTFDLVSRVLGVPLMRQVRIKNGMSF